MSCTAHKQGRGGERERSMHSACKKGKEGGKIGIYDLHSVCKKGGMGVGLEQDPSPSQGMYDREEVKKGGCE